MASIATAIRVISVSAARIRSDGQPRLEAAVKQGAIVPEAVAIFASAQQMVSGEQDARW
jgi:hypothetical protein